MNRCEETLQALQATLDAATEAEPLSPEVREHLNACAACRAAEAELCAFEALARQAALQAEQAQDASFPADLHARIMQGISDEGRTRPARRREARRGSRQPISGRSRMAIRIGVMAAGVMVAWLITRPQPESALSRLSRAPLAALRELAPLPVEVAAAPQLLADAEDGLASLGLAIYSATGGALRAVSPVESWQWSELDDSPMS